MSNQQRLSKDKLIRRRSRRGSPESAGEKKDVAKAATAAVPHESEERLRAILQTAVEGIITIDERGLIESMNPAAERIFGWTAKEIVGKNVNLLMPSPYREEHDTYLSNYLRTGCPHIIGIGRAVVGKRKDQSLFPMDLAVSEVRLADRRLFTGFVRDISERQELQQEILEISERERRRIGHDLHDGLCQQLAAIELMTQVLEQNLAPKSQDDAARVGEIGRFVREAISQTRSLARGLSPVTMDSEGLMSALAELAANTERMFRVQCRFLCEPPVLVHDPAVSAHLYRIAQEAVSNAIKHGKAKEIVLRLEAGKRTVLSISDNGAGFPKNDATDQGMGLRIMQYRAGMIGGTLTMENNRAGRGARVVCSFVDRDNLNGPAQRQ